MSGRERSACEDGKIPSQIPLLWYLNGIKFNYSGYIGLGLEFAVIPRDVNIA